MVCPGLTVSCLRRRTRIQSRYRLIALMLVRTYRGRTGHIQCSPYTSESVSANELHDAWAYRLT